MPSSPSTSSSSSSSPSTSHHHHHHHNHHHHIAITSMISIAIIMSSSWSISTILLLHGRSNAPRRHLRMSTMRSPPWHETGPAATTITNVNSVIGRYDQYSISISILYSYQYQYQHHCQCHYDPYHVIFINNIDTSIHQYQCSIIININININNITIISTVTYHQQYCCHNYQQGPHHTAEAAGTCRTPTTTAKVSDE